MLIVNNLGYRYLGETKEPPNWKDTYNANQDNFDYWINFDFEPVITKYKRLQALKSKGQSLDDQIRFAEHIDKFVSDEEPKD